MPIDPRIAELENEIKQRVIIPQDLSQNMGWSTTSLGGLFLSYWSNIHKNSVHKQNSKVHFTLMISVEDKYGMCHGRLATLDITQKRPEDIKLIGFKKPVDIDKVINRINKFIEKYHVDFVNSIER